MLGGKDFLKEDRKPVIYTTGVSPLQRCYLVPGIYKLHTEDWSQGITENTCINPWGWWGQGRGDKTSLVAQQSACNAGDPGLIPGLGRSPGEGNGNPLQYSCLENPYGQRSLADYSSWGCKELNRTETFSDIERNNLAEWEFIF